MGESRHPIDLKWDLYEVPPYVRSRDRLFTWETNGGAKIEALLQHTDLVDLRYLIENAEAGRPVPRWQDLPRGAKINAANVHRIQRHCGSGLAVLVLSYPWLDPGHPDGKLSTMRRLLPLLKAFLAGLGHEEQRCTVGVLMDYPCLPQKSPSGTDDRSDDEKARFKKGLSTINQWYLHEKTTVVVYDAAMPGPDSGHANLRPHWQRGWCAFELRAASVIKYSQYLWSLRGFEDGGSDPTYHGAMRDAKSKVVRPAPMDPDSFGAVLRGGVAAGELAFTAKADLEVVAEQYAKAFETAYADAKELIYAELGWGDEQMKTLASALAHAKKAGGLSRLTFINVSSNPCSEAGLYELVEALRGTNCKLWATETKCSKAGQDEVLKAAEGAGVTVVIQIKSRRG